MPEHARNLLNRDMHRPPICRVLIADTPKAIKDFQSALQRTQIEVLRAHTFDEAIALAHEGQPHLYIIGYHFDEARPYRLIQQLRADFGDAVPILLIRALPLSGMDREDAYIRESYLTLGANDYVPLYDHAQQESWDAARFRLAEAVGHSLRNANCLP